MKLHHMLMVIRPSHKILAASLLGLSALNVGVHAATDISNTPLATTSDITAKPNVMFILDDSGSMSWDYMPDDMRDSTAYGHKSRHCNGVAFDPTYDYNDNLPMNSDGTLYPSVPFNAAPSDGFQISISSSTSKNLTGTIPTDLGEQTFEVFEGGGTSFAKDQRVGIVNGSDNTQWMVGIVKSWNNPKLVVNVTGKAGNFDTTVTWKVGRQNVNDLSTSYYYQYTGGKAAMGWKYTKDGLNQAGDGGFSAECKATSGGPFTKVTLSSQSAAIQQQYANWYAYYRTRALMMRTAAGRAFSPVDAKYRVGFSTISSKTAAPSSSFLPVGPFSGAQKIAFYNSLYRSDPDGSTPLRGALSKAGRYFANKASGQTSDPMEYACQRNYTILSTDGYWNDESETTSYGPLKLDGVTKVGQQDGTGMEVKPYWDGEKSVVTITTPITVTRTQTSSYDRTTTTVISTGTPTYTSNSCGFFQTRWTTTANQTKRVLVETISQPQTVSGSYNNVVKETNGTVTSNVDATLNWGSPTNTGAATTTTKSDTTGTSSTSVTGSCGGSKPTLPTSPTISNGTAAVSNVVDGTPVAGAPSRSQPTLSDGSSDSLADVAEYYYVTDLRTSGLGNCSGAKGSDVCNNEVPINGLDRAEHQHMTTFTLGMGMSGVLPYNKDYLNPSLRSGTYFELKRTDGTLTWPLSGGDTKGVVHVDDLWHAAVNGRGQYWSASDPSGVGEAIGSALSNVQRTDGASSSAATSSLKPVKGNSNQVFVAKYTTKAWIGELVSYSLNGTTGEINTTTAVWSAAAEMGKQTPSARNIYYAQPNSTTRRDFTYANLNADGLGSNFTNFCSKPVTADQCPSFDTAPLAQANSGTNLVNYLRGDESLSSYSYTDGGTAKTATIYRPRESMLGDIINASPVYVSKPPFHYADVGYSDFVSAQSGRRPVVFAAANDGMLHAFAAESTTGGTAGGTELWAFIPTAVMPNLYRLADTGYDAKHHFFVDGTPTVGDIKVGDTWKTILVGGLNAGGKSYYALDITDPLNPKILWEFTDANMGLTYGNPLITKRKDGTWVVVLTSGYNNTDGDGNGRLYVLNANTGAPVSDFPTGIPTMVSSNPAGTKAAPSGLGKVNAWIEDSSDNTSTRFYGGDLLGNLWRFDIDSLVAPKGKAMLLATFQTGASKPQPITVRPEPATVTYGNVDYSVILVATGQYLGLTDIADKSTQSIYAIKDSLDSTGLGDVRQRTDMVAQTLSTTTTTTRTASTTEVNWANQVGWRIDLPSEGERVAVDMQLQYTTLAVLSAIPGSSVCSPSGGSAWLYNLDIAKGSSPLNAPEGSTGTKLGTFLGVGLTWVELTNGKSLLIIPGSNAKITTASPPTAGSTGSGSVNRTSWRELVN